MPTGIARLAKLRVLKDAYRQVIGDDRESEERFRTLADDIAQLAWMADPTGWIFWYNRRWFIGSFV